VVPDVSEERIASIFRVVEEAAKVPLNALHGAISQKKILFKTTAVKTSNPTW
jgi:tRNA(Met) C34 N-acetyltransferase TmcA